MSLDPSTVPDELIHLCRFLGDPSLDGAILAEGNASILESDAAFWVKASGFSMRAIDASGFVRIDLGQIRDALARDDLTDAQVREVLKASRVDEKTLMPSVETFMHAYLLGLPGVSIVGHTHPTPLISLLCLQGVQEMADQRIFPDEVVCCGPAAAFVPYVDPGFQLASAIRASVERYVESHGVIPKTIWMQNHGLIALGKSSKEVESATLMSIKAARAWLGALSTGRPLNLLTQDQVERIHTRPDEHYRQRLLWELRG